MNLYYAIGGGLGHLSRAGAFLHTLAIDKQDVIIVTSSSYADKVFPDFQTVLIPNTLSNNPAKLQLYLLKIVEQYQVFRIFLDAFPCGMFGEWIGFPLKNLQFDLVARVLNLPNYIFKQSEYPQFSQIYICELLAESQKNILHEVCNSVKNINLIYPKHELTASIKQILHKISKPIWLIVHSEPESELLVLLNYAKDLAMIEKTDPFFLIISQCNLPTKNVNEMVIDYYPAYSIFQFVDKIFTASGFNSMSQTNTFREKHYFIPFQRRYDDQFLRAALRKASFNTL